MPIRDAQISLLALGKQLWRLKDRQLQSGVMYLEGDWLSSCKTLVCSAVFKVFNSGSIYLELQVFVIE